MASTLSISGEPGDKGLPGKNGKDGKYYIILFYTSTYVSEM
jgi:hypothetical protein